MKKFVLVFVCLLVFFTVQASGDNQGNECISNINPAENSPVWKTLEKLTTYEKSNAIIDIECEEDNQARADIIEKIWNNGSYEEAIRLLKNLPDLDNAAIGIQWKEPVKTPLTRWAGDVRVGTVDSIMDIDLDVDNSNGNLFAVLLYRDGPSDYNFTTNISTDTGKTWTETYVWTASPDYFFDIDCAYYKNNFYLAYTYADNSLGRIRRFSSDDGTVDGDYAYVTVINEGDTLREISLISGADHPNPFSQQILYLSIMENDSIRVYTNNDDSLAISWYSFNPPVENASRGLDACCAVDPNKLWASYIGTDDELYFIGGWGSWTVVSSHLDLGPYSDMVTSVGAYGDTVIVVFPFQTSDTTYDVRYYFTSNNGTNWGVGNILYNSSLRSPVNDVTARGGDGIGAVYQTVGDSAEGVYRNRKYNFSLWTPGVSFADNVPRANVKPCIERIADGIYGILYVNWPEQMAWFDRNDWFRPDDLSLFSDRDTVKFGETSELSAYLEKGVSGVNGEELNFEVISGDGSVDPTSGVTDGSGEVYTEFTAGSTEETVTVQVMWVSEHLIDTLRATVDIEVVSDGGIAEGPAESGISAVFGTGEVLCAAAEEGEFTVKVYDKLGREAGILLNKKVKRWYHSLSLKNLKLSSDIYFVVMRGPGVDKKIIKVTLIN
jgi:hypothetical protein